LPNEGERLAPESAWLRNLASEAIVGEPEGCQNSDSTFARGFGGVSDGFLRAHGGFGTMWFCSEVRSRLGLGVPVFLCFTRAREYQKPLNGAKNGQL